MQKKYDIGPDLAEYVSTYASLPEGYGSFTCHNDFCDLKYLLDQVNILFICCNQPLFTARNFKKPT